MKLGYTKGMYVWDPEPYRDQIAALCRQYHVRELAVFGSALGPNFGPQSDIDLLVSFEPDAKIGLFALFHLQEELAGLLQRKVDLVSKNGLKPLIRDEVLAAGPPAVCGVTSFGCGISSSPQTSGY